MIETSAAAMAPDVRPDRAIKGDWKCTICGDVLPTHRELARHWQTQHQLAREARTRVSVMYCPCCMAWFPNRAKVMAHLHENSFRCLLNVIMWLPPLPEC